MIATRLKASLGLGLALVACAGGAVADDIDAGRAKARACAVCHGPLGVAVAPETPNLAGQPANYLATQLRAYRSGVRKHEVMAVMAKPLLDAEIEQLAAWFASLKVSVTPPP